MNSKLLKAGGLAALIATSCSASAQNPFERAYRNLNPQSALRSDFERSVQDYRQCLSAHANDMRACEGQRAIMEATSRAFSGSAGTTVYVPPR
jgi:hypothetical protein